MKYKQAHFQQKTNDKTLEEKCSDCTLWLMWGLFHIQLPTYISWKESWVHTGHILLDEAIAEAGNEKQHSHELVPDYFNVTINNNAYLENKNSENLCGSVS